MTENIQKMEMGSDFRTRLARSNDFSFLEHMLFEAFFWNPDNERPQEREFLDRPEIAIFLADWGRRGDVAVIGELENKAIGAAWFRLGTEKVHFYGYVDDKTPELGLGVVADYRSRGVGRVLLQKLCVLARQDGYSAISLSVDPNNFARKLYESEGFVKVGESGTSWTMILNI